MTDKQKKALTITGIVIFFALMALAAYFVGRPMIRYVKEPEKFREWVSGYGAFGKAIFVGTVFLQTVVAFIPGEPFEIAAGYAFGTLAGTLLCLIGETLGSVAVFLFVRRFGMKAVEVFFPREKIESLKFLRNEKKLEVFTFFVFLVPGTPKDLLCYFAGLTPMRLGVWLLISSVARFPSVITSTVGGNALGIGNFTFAVIVFGITLALSGAGLVIYNAVVKRRARETDLAQKAQKKGSSAHEGF